MKTVFTTGQVAKITKVAPRTVSKWFDAGRFEDSYRIPGSQDRRIPVKGLLKFLRAAGMKDAVAQVEIESKFQILAVGLEKSVCDRVNVTSDAINFTCAESLFDAGKVVAGLTPNVIILDSTGLGLAEVKQAVQIIRRTQDLAGVIIFALTGEDNSDGIEGVDVIFQRPLDPAAITLQIADYLKKAA